MLYEVITDEIPYKFRDHGWMAAIAEKDGRRFAIACLVEHGLHGASGAGPVVKAVIDYLFLDKVRVNPEERKQKAREARLITIKPKTKTQGRITSYNVCYTKLLRPCPFHRYVSGPP